MHRVAVLALDRVVPDALAIPFQVFGGAHDAGGERLYEVGLVSRRRGPVRTAAGFLVEAPRGLRGLGACDTVVMAGSVPPGSGDGDDVSRALRRVHDRGGRIVSLCTAAFVLARSGLLDGRRATTHWRHCDAFAARFPAVRLDPDVLYVEEERILTSAGSAAAIDLCLHVVASDFGAGVANRVARGAVVAPLRSGAQAQLVERPVPVSPEDTLEPTRAWALERLAEPLTLDDLARHASVSRRTLIRRFQSETGTTPLQWLIEQRVMRARLLLESTEMPVEQVARDSGFGSAPSLRTHFGRSVGASPQSYRAAFRARAAAGTSAAIP